MENNGAPGYKSTRRNRYSQRQRRSHNKKLAKAKAAKGEFWLPLEEYRKLKRSIHKNPEPTPQVVAQDNFKSLTLDEKTELVRPHICKHGLLRVNCRRCLKKWRKTYKIPKIKQCSE